MIDNQKLIDFLGQLDGGRSWLKKLKTKYRPVICPFPVILKLILGVESVFDVGCGAGQLCYVLANYTSVRKIKGIEIDDSLIEQARKNLSFRHGKQMHFAVYNGLSLPKDIKEYDAVLLIDVLHHIPKKQQITLLQNLYNQMKKGAIFLLKDIDASHPFVLANKIHDFIFSGQIGREISFSKAVDTLKKIGFCIKKEVKKRFLFTPITLFWRKKNKIVT